VPLGDPGRGSLGPPVGAAGGRGDSDPDRGAGRGSGPCGARGSRSAPAGRLLEVTDVLL